MNKSTKDRVFDAISDTLPKFFKINEQNIYSPKTIYNLISKGQGPDIVKIRGRIFFERDSFIEWLQIECGYRGRNKNGINKKKGLK